LPVKFITLHASAENQELDLTAISRADLSDSSKKTAGPIVLELEPRTPLYVNGSAHTTLVVHDLKKPSAAGAIARWIDPGTVAHFL